MTTTISAPRYISLEDFDNIPEGPPFYEREPDGRLIEVASAKIDHNTLMGRLFGGLDAHVRLQRLGRVVMVTDVYFSSGRVYIPDVCFLTREQLSLIGEDGKVHGAPTMVAELVSEGGQSRDRVAKRHAYEEEGVEWYWLIDSETLDIDEYHLEDGRYIRTAHCAFGEDFEPLLLPGWSANLAELMAE